MATKILGACSIKVKGKLMILSPVFMAIQDVFVFRRAYPRSINDFKHNMRQVIADIRCEELFSAACVGESSSVSKKMAHISSNCYD